MSVLDRVFWVTGLFSWACLGAGLVALATNAVLNRWEKRRGRRPQWGVIRAVQWEDGTTTITQLLGRPAERAIKQSAAIAERRAQEAEAKRG